ncbi:Hypothetical predicted protein [Mytilus galloprovincialis]|uniref:DEAD/DEAH-box helicase domain-containing protein n=1 Tax=Mytilus galloprovincialis TaxID=29158 RepID=A0A8B6CYJ9_MYTGA|nr:Hypothetical predicted protein [Mytilus galloprovincialis]
MADYKSHLRVLNKESVNLKEKQIEILDMLQKGLQKGKKEIIVILPTGYGKSLIYEIAPLMLSGTVIVISPLTSIQVEQFQRLRETPLKTCILNVEMKVGVELKRIASTLQITILLRDIAYKLIHIEEIGHIMDNGRLAIRKHLRGLDLCVYFLQRYLPEAHLIIKMDREISSVSPKDKQEETLAHLLHEGSGDLLLNLPVGYGKSLVYKPSPFSKLHRPPWSFHH